MLPQFPEFKNLELSDRSDIDSIVRQFPPYSDFNFLSMWAWNVKGSMMISEFNRNLIVKFTDYVTGESVYSFLGVNESNCISKKLLDLSIEEGLSAKLRLVPECSIQDLDSNIFCVEEDRDSFDYLLSPAIVKDLAGDKFANKRNQINKLANSHNVNFALMDLKDLHNHEKLKNLFKIWINQKGSSQFYEAGEFIAFCRILEVADVQNMILTVILDSNGGIVAFWLIENMGNGYAMSHFQKADYVGYVGIYPLLMRESSGVLFDLGIEFINMEQDLGIVGLRESKSSYSPVGFLKKYSIEYKK